MADHTDVESELEVRLPLRPTLNATDEVGRDPEARLIEILELGAT